jgi:hypothetical protein
LAVQYVSSISNDTSITTSAPAPQAESISEEERFSLLLLKLHKEYRENINGKYTPAMFAKRFIARNKHIDETSADALNDHNWVLSLIETLLFERTDIQRKYFNKEQLSQDDINAILSLLCSEKVINPRKRSTSNEIKHNLTNEHISIIAECINANRIFSHTVTAEQFKNLLKNEIKEPLILNDKIALCHLFNLLDRKGYIDKWQTNIEKAQSIICKTTNQPIKASNLSSTTSYYLHNQDLEIHKKINSYIDRFQDLAVA